MSYRVIYTPLFLKDIDDHVDYLLSQGASVQTISAWYDRLFERLEALDDMPKRLPVDERLSNLTGKEYRKLNYGEYFAFYRIFEDEQRVDVLHFQHGARERERYAKRDQGFGR
jgi:plasmid stabilization system protein ParE